MFIQLTRLNGSPLWLNPEFLLRIEPWKAGSLVVPAGDDLDYEVKETPETLMSMIGGCVKPPALPARALDSLSDEEKAALAASEETGDAAETPAEADAEEAPKKRTRRTTKKKAEADGAAEADAAEAPKKRARRTTKKAAEAEEAKPAETAPATSATATVTETKAGDVTITVTAAPAETPAGAVETVVEPARLLPPVQYVFPAPDEGLVREAAAKVKQLGCKSQKKILNALRSLYRKKAEEEIIGMFRVMEFLKLVVVQENGRATFA